MLVEKAWVDEFCQLGRVGWLRRFGWVIYIRYIGFKGAVWVFTVFICIGVLFTVVGVFT